MTKEEMKEAMEEMECWSCNNHLNICDKHTCRDNEAKECKHEDKDACIEPCNHDEVCGSCGKCFPDTTKECTCGEQHISDRIVHRKDGPCYVKDTPTPPSKQPTPRESICKKCGKSWPPRQGTYIVPLEYKEELCGECNYQPTRLELIREKIRLSGVARMNGRDVKYILSKLATANEALEEVMKLDPTKMRFDDMCYKMKGIANEALKSINEN